MRTVLSVFFLLCAVDVLPAADWKFSKSIIFGHANAPALLKPYIAPGAPGGWMVLIEDMPESARGANAYEIYLSYEDPDSSGGILARAVAYPEKDGNGKTVIGAFFSVGDSAKVTSISAYPLKMDPRVVPVAQFLETCAPNQADGGATCAAPILAPIRVQQRPNGKQPRGYDVQFCNANSACQSVFRLLFTDGYLNLEPIE